MHRANGKEIHSFKHLGLTYSYFIVGLTIIGATIVTIMHLVLTATISTTISLFEILAHELTTSSIHSYLFCIYFLLFRNSLGCNWHHQLTLLQRAPSLLLSNRSASQHLVFFFLLLFKFLFCFFIFCRRRRCRCLVSV